MCSVTDLWLSLWFSNLFALPVPIGTPAAGVKATADWGTAETVLHCLEFKIPLRRERQKLAPQNGTGADKCIPKVGAEKVGGLIFSFVPLTISPVTKCREGNSSLTEQSLQTRLAGSNIMSLTS